MNENERLEAFEKMLASLQKQYDDTVQKLSALKANGREKTVTYKQLLANKLQLQSFLTVYRLHGLLP